MIAGIDISLKKLDVWQNGNSQCFDNNAAGFQRLLAWLAPQSVCVMEATGPYGLKLAYFLHSQEVNVCIVNPLSIKSFAKTKLLRVKTDAVDAALIAEYGRLMDPPAWQPPQDTAVALRQANQRLVLLKRQRTALICQMKAFLHDPAHDKYLLAEMKEEYNWLGQRIKKVVARIGNILDEHYQELSRILTSIPGVGIQTAALLIAITDGFTRFESAKQLACFIGIAPRVIQSGTISVKNPGISKVGLASVRHTLYVCALSATRFNPACQQQFQRLKENGKPAKVALTAVAHKLVKIAFAVAMSGVPFDPNKILVENPPSLAC